MNVLILMYRRFQRIQEQRWFLLSATAAVVVAWAAVAGPLMLKSASLASQRQALNQVFQEESLADRDPLVTSFFETGFLEVNGRRYGREDLRNARDLFAEDGRAISPRFIANLLLSDQRPQWAPAWLLDQPGTTQLLAVVMLTWLLLVVWMRLTAPFVLTSVGVAVAVFIAAIFTDGYFQQQLQLSLAGIGLLMFTFVMLTHVFEALLNRPVQPLAVAHTVLKEASRTRLSLFFIVLLLVVLPLLPLWLDPESPLRFRVQTFISRSLNLTFVLAGVMTLFLACSTVAFEIRDRQIWQLMTKPVGHFRYLFGKWLGVMIVNLIILIVAGVSTFSFIQYLRTLPVAPGMEGAYDRAAVNQQILTARRGVYPTLNPLSGEQLRARIDEYINNDPELNQMQTVPAAYRNRIGQELQQQHLNRQRSIQPVNDLGQPGRQELVFHNLDVARQYDAPLVLRYQFFILRDDTHQTYPAVFEINNDPSIRFSRNYVPTISHTFSVSKELIREDGSLSLTIYNTYMPTPEQRGRGQLNFESNSIEIMYKVGEFEPNFFRAIMVNWVKLGFLAALGIAAATFLSFPVAILTSFTIFLAGSMAPFLGAALDQFQTVPASQVDWSNLGAAMTWLFYSAVNGIARFLVFTLRGFGDYRSTQRLVEGRVIDWVVLVVGVFKLIGIWSTISMLIGWLVLRGRQLAIYSGHG